MWGCHTPITNPHDGVIIQGNIYVANPLAQGGLVGNNFPDTFNTSMPIVDQIQETVFCKSCLMQVLFPTSGPIPRRHK